MRIRLEKIVAAFGEKIRIAVEVEDDDERSFAGYEPSAGPTFEQRLTDSAFAQLARLEKTVPGAR